MSVADYHIAQFNTARIRAELDQPQMQGFVASLDRINALADHAPGFVWRLQTDSGNSVDVRPYADQQLLITLSVWQTIDALHAFTYRAEHAAMLRQRAQWFEHLEGQYIALWWVPAGAIPSVDEGVQRLAHLQRFGPTQQAFTFGERFEPPARASGGSSALRGDLG